MKIRTRAFLLGLIPALLMALVLTAFHVYSRVAELDGNLSQQGMALARHLAASAEYGVVSGNDEALEMLLDQTISEQGVESVLLIWPEGRRMARGEAGGALSLQAVASRWQDPDRSWFAHPVRLTPTPGSDLYLDAPPASREPLAWVAVGIDLGQREQLVAQLLLASAGITLLGILLATLLVRQLALTGVRPLMDIIASVRRIGSGAFGAQMEVTANSPELRELQAMVNRMSESLRSYQQEMEAKIRIATAELEHKTREAEQANQAKSRFLAAASHDLRQPMHAISLYVESLKPGLKGLPAEQTLLKLERSISSMIEMFNTILDVSRLDAGVIQPRLAPVRIRRLLLDIADEFAVECDAKGLSLRVHAADRWVESDPVLLERIVRNLLSNALRHTTRGGVLLSARPCHGKVRVQVWDTGSGIAPEHQPHVFYEFYQVEPEGARARHGLGLGLSIVRRLARLLRYPLQLQSRPGKGTVFSLDLPLTTAPCAGECPSVIPVQALAGRAVVIDDDADVRDALGRLLTGWGMEVQTFARLGELDEGLSQPPDVVLADYQLEGGETGLEAVESIRARWGAGIPAILVTGDTRAEAVQRFNALTMPVLYKPVQPTQLLALLQAGLSRRTMAAAMSGRRSPEAGATSPSAS